MCKWCVYLGMHLLWSACGSQRRIVWSQPPPPPFMRVAGIELGLSGLLCKLFTCWAISLDPDFLINEQKNLIPKRSQPMKNVSHSKYPFVWFCYCCFVFAFWCRLFNPRLPQMFYKVKNNLEFPVVLPLCPESLGFQTCTTTLHWILFH